MKTPFYMGILAAFALSACAPDSPATKAARARQENMERLGDAFKAVNDAVKQGDYDAAELVENVTAIDNAAQSMGSWFAAGSGPQDGAKTGAKSDIWDKPMEFADEIRLLQQQTGELRAAAPDGADAVAAQAADVGARCKSCHEQYRVERN